MKVSFLQDNLSINPLPYKTLPIITITNIHDAATDLFVKK